MPFSSHYTIRQLADLYGLTLRTLRHYEDAGLIKPARKGSQRFYDEGERVKLELICRARHIGLSLEEIKEFLGFYGSNRWSGEALSTLIKKLETQRKNIEITLNELQTIQNSKK